MFARPRTQVALFFLSFCSSWAEDIPVSGQKLFVFLKAAPEVRTAGTFRPFQEELQTLMQAAGYKVAWLEPGTLPEAGVEGELAVIELRGSCEGRVGPITRLNPGSSLARTAISDGRVLPFSRVDCETLDQFVAPQLAGLVQGRRSGLYGRAMARVAAHELYHVLANNTGHSNAGIAQTALTVEDLLGARLVFAKQTLTQLRGEPSLSAAEPAGDEILLGR